MDKTDTLVFENVSIAPSDADVGGLAEASFSIAPGGLVWVHIDPDQPIAPFAALALGLEAPDSGQVRFHARDWQTMDAFQQAAARGSTGVVFERPCWVSNLTISENILLRLQHHTHATAASLRADADRKVRALGLSGIRDDRPDRVAALELRVLEWGRAFMGEPSLVVLVCPTRGAPSWSTPKLAQLLSSALAQGTAALWISDFEKTVQVEAPGGIATYHLHGEQLTQQ